jgi:hypothetical protein
MAVSGNSRQTERPTKWEVVYEDEDHISIWRYNSKITTHGPVEVEHKYKKGFTHPMDVKKKTLGDLAKAARKDAKSKKTKS